MERMIEEEELYVAFIDLRALDTLERERIWKVLEVPKYLINIIKSTYVGLPTIL